MGAWGAGSFDNDEALDWLAQAPDVAGLAGLFGEASAEFAQSGELDATTASRVLAAAELVAAARGHGLEGLPGDAVTLARALGKPEPALVEQAREAVSAVLGGSELAELWAESDEPGEWSRAVTSLVARLDRPEREAKLGKRAREMSACVCSFCNETVPTGELVELRARLPTDLPGMERGFFAHEGCLNARLDPRRLLQWWTIP